MEAITWVIQHQAELLQDVGTVLVALMAVIHGLGLLAKALGVVAKVIPGETDDNIVAKFAEIVAKAQSGVDWVHHMLFRAGMQAREPNGRPSIAPPPPAK